MFISIKDYLKYQLILMFDIDTIRIASGKLEAVMIFTKQNRPFRAHRIELHKMSLAGAEI